MFKGGDKVKCVKVDFQLTLNDVYMVIKTANYNGKDLVMIDNKTGYFYDSSLFEKVEDLKFKNGSRVWSCIHGWGTVSAVDSHKYYPICVSYDNCNKAFYTKDGKLYISGKFPEIFLDEVKLEDWPNPPAKLDPSTLSTNQEIEVKLADHEGWVKRNFACLIYGQVFVCSVGKTLEYSKSLHKAVEFRLPVD